jgi:hypothetical protein
MASRSLRWKIADEIDTLNDYTLHYTLFFRSESIMIKVTRYHDGCNICKGISVGLTPAFATPNHFFESINLDTQRNRAREAKALGIKRLPSLVIRRESDAPGRSFPH